MTDTETRHSKLKKTKARNIILNLVCTAIAIAGIWGIGSYFTLHAMYEITNDAFVDQYISPLNIRASGYVREVRFREHQPVRKGDTLLVIDATEHKIKVTEAEAALLQAEAAKEILLSEIETSEANIEVIEANISEAKAKLWQYEQDYNRFERLMKEESVSGQQYEQAKAAYEAAEARYYALLGQKKAAHSQCEEKKKHVASADASIMHARAALEMARLDLSYTVVTAPYDGYTGRRSIEPGQYVQAGTTMTNMIRGNGKWITANYKERQIENIYMGQPVRIKVDAIPGKTFSGRVSAISGATGSKYSLVPTDNSAGNFVKVQQRIPVRIELEDADSSDMELMKAGMMVVTQARKRHAAIR